MDLLDKLRSMATHDATISEAVDEITFWRQSYPGQSYEKRRRRITFTVHYFHAQGGAWYHTADFEHEVAIDAQGSPDMQDVLGWVRVNKPGLTHGHPRELEVVIAGKKGYPIRGTLG